VRARAPVKGLAYLSQSCVRDERVSGKRGEGVRERRGAPCDKDDLDRRLVCLRRRACSPYSSIYDTDVLEDRRAIGRYLSRVDRWWVEL
jgi:hypothetical protein